MPALQYCLLVISFRETKQCINQSSVAKKKHTLHMIVLYVYVRYCNDRKYDKQRPSSSFLYKYTCTLYIHASVLRSKRCILYSDIKRVWPWWNCWSITVNMTCLLAQSMVKRDDSSKLNQNDSSVWFRSLVRYNIVLHLINVMYWLV